MVSNHEWLLNSNIPNIKSDNLGALRPRPGPPTSVPSMGPSDRSPLCLTAVIESLTKIPRRNQRLMLGQREK
jgi:hypothetical protein